MSTETSSYFLKIPIQSIKKIVFIKVYSKEPKNYPLSNNMKSLEDSCIHCIMNHVQDIPNIRGKLPRIYKELLLTRLSEHNLLTPNILGCVNRELCVNSLQHLQLSHCSQVNDQFLKSFANTQRQLKTILIEKCDVSGHY